LVGISARTVSASFSSFGALGLRAVFGCLLGLAFLLVILLVFFHAFLGLEFFCGLDMKLLKIFYGSFLCLYIKLADPSTSKPIGCKELVAACNNWKFMDVLLILHYIFWLRNTDYLVGLLWLV